MIASVLPTKQALLLVVVLLVAVLMRVGYVDVVGHSDIAYFQNRAASIAQHGLFSIYSQDEGRDFNYPPLYFYALAALNLVAAPQADAADGIDPAFMRAHKWVQIGVDLALIVVAYVWSGHRVTQRRKTQDFTTEAQSSTEEYRGWFFLGQGEFFRSGAVSLLIPLLIAVYPGVIVTGVFWGQTDALWTLFVALALIAIERERPGWAWVCFALGVLTKFQAVYIFPLLLVLTVRRCGLRATITSLALGGLVGVALLLPFMLNSGIERVLRPFTVAVDFFPSTTVWALNLWYAVIPSNWGAHPALVYENIPDTLLLGPLSYKQVGLLLLALYTLLIVVAAWRRGDERRAFVWAAALGFGFFMLPTQMHERYLFPAALLLLLGAAQDWRLWLPALLTIFTYSYNVIVPTHAPFEWLGVNLLFTFGDVTLRTALLNLLIFAAVTWVAVTDAPESPPHLYWQGLRLRIRTALAAGGVLTAGLLIAIALPVLLPPTLPAEARPVNALFDDSLWLKGYALAQDGQTWHLTLYWQAQRFNNRDLTVFVHAVRGGQTIAQRDEKPLNGVYPTWRWFYNRLVVTHYTLVLPEGTPPDSLYAGLYDASSAALVQDGQAVADGRALLCGGSAPCS